MIYIDFFTLGLSYRVDAWALLPPVELGENDLYKLLYAWALLPHRRLALLPPVE